MRIKMPAVRIAQADTEVVHQDILTCGVCQKPFALSDIVKFIQHKVLACNKENYSLAPGAGGGGDQDSDGDNGNATPVPLSVANQRRPSISAPINAKKNTVTSGVPTPQQQRGLCTPPLVSPRLPTDMNMDETPPTSTPKRRVSSSPHLDDDLKPRIKQEMDVGSSPDEALVKRSRIDVVDAESNTTHSEPSNYVCSTCKQRLHSAWRLVQHVQNSHGIKIYVESSPSSSSQGSASSPCTTSTLSNPKSATTNNNNHSSSSSSSCSGSSTSSGCSSTSNHGRTTTPQGTPLSLPPPGVTSRLAHHQSLHHPPPSIDSLHPIINNNPFGVGGLLRMPLGDRPHHQFPPTSMAAPISHHGAVGNGSTIFARPSSHDHHFRMEQLVSEQFRLNPHGLGLAAAVAAVSGVPPPHSPFGPPLDRLPSLPTSNSRSSTVVPSSPTLSLSLEPQLDFYSQRLRQLAGTTSPGAATNGSPSPSPRKPILTPPFTSPSSARGGGGAATPTMINNNTAHSLNANHSRPESLSSPEKQSPLSDPVHSSAAMTSSTPRSASTPPNNFKPSELTLRPESAATGNRDHRERIRSCEFCGKKFRFQSNLIVHRRTHTGEKPYKCSVCNHACTQSSKLKRHMKIHRRNRAGNGGTGGEGGTAAAAAAASNNCGSTNSTPDNASHAGSVETLDDDIDDDDEDDDEEEDEEEDEDEEEEMELEEEEDDDNFDDDLGGDAPEDLTTKSSSSTPPNHTTPDNSKVKTARPIRTPTPLEKISTSGSLVGELMDKFGLSNIQQYNEAYKQALQESVIGSHHLHIKDDLHRSHLIPDNNNGGGKSSPMIKSIENGLIDKTAAAMRFREEFAKNMIAAGQPPLDLIGVTHGLFGPGTPFENPFDAANKRMKMDLENHHHHHHAALTRGGLPGDRDGLYAGLWLPAMAAHHRDHLFGNDTNPMDLLSTRAKTGENAMVKSSGKNTPSAASLAAAAVAINMGMSNHGGGGGGGGGGNSQHHLKKDSRRNDTCEYCGKVFKNCSNLTVHRRSHTGEKPYKCELCSYACAQSSKLTRHMKTHGRLGKDVYRCRFCEMPFSVPSTLEKHMRKCVVNQNNKGGHMIPSIISEDTGDSSTSASKDT